VTLRRWLTLTACCLGTFLLLVHTTAATVSVAAIARDLDAGFAQGQWIINGYSLAVGALLLAAGAVGDALDHRRVFVSGMVVFILGTTGCAAAPTASVLIASRVVQGVGGAALLASMIPLLVHSYTGRQRATALAIWSVCSAMGGTIGTLGSGLLAQPSLWRWLFIASLPVAVTGLVIAVVITDGAPDGGPARRLDWLGTGWTIGVLGSATFALTAAGEFGIASRWTLGAIGVTLISITGLVTTERRVAAPALPPGLFASRQFVGAVVTAFAYYLAAFGPLPTMALWLTGFGGLDPAAAAALLAVQQVGFIVVAALLRVPERHHTAALALGMIAIVVGVLLAAVVVAAALPASVMLGPLVLSGAGAGVVTPILPHRATEAAAPALAGAAAGTLNAVRQFGLAAGVAACSAVARATTTTPGAGAAVALLLAAAVATAGLIAQRALRAPEAVARDRRRAA